MSIFTRKCYKITLIQQFVVNKMNSFIELFFYLSVCPSAIPIPPPSLNQWMFVGQICSLMNVVDHENEWFWGGEGPWAWAWRIIEPLHDKTNKMTVHSAKTRISPGIRPIWPESSLYAQWVAKNPSFLHADSEDSDQTGRMHQTGRMPRLISVSYLQNW